eukprot:maker-scaffold_5-snap-gene-8.11-mRNA-1 protein AED:0.00 eAED:0.00 QI:60/1/1/1/0.5/0.33/3/62/272
MSKEETLEEFIAKKRSSIALTHIAGEFLQKHEQRMKKVAVKRPSSQRLNSAIEQLVHSEQRNWFAKDTDIQLRTSVLCPEGIPEDTWLVAGAYDFYNELTNIWLFCSGGSKRYMSVGSGFPPGHIYRWNEEGGDELVSSPEYIKKAFSFLKNLFSDEAKYPTLEGSVQEAKVYHYDRDVSVEVKELFILFFKILSILYHKFLYDLQMKDADGHLHMVLKHWVFFVCEQDIYPDDSVLEPLKDLVLRHKDDYEVALEKMLNRFKKGSEQSAFY